MTATSAQQWPPKPPRWVSDVGWRTVVGGLLAGGIIHIVATFATPMLGSGNAFAKLRTTLPQNAMVVVPPVAPGKQILPYVPPDAMYAMCRFDLTTGPVNVTALIADTGWVLSMHTPQGDNFYVMPRQLLRRDEVSFTIVPRSLTEHGRSPKIAGPTDSQVISPTVEGLIVVRAPLKGIAWQAETEAQLKRSGCTQVKG
jgi:uncharacterized membrane protein